MIRIVISIIGCIFFLPVFAQPAGYYTSADGKTGEELQQALHDIIDDHTVKSYDYLWTAFYTTDERADGFVWDMYSDNPEGTNPYDYTFGTEQCGNYSGEGSCYNREHSFPKSWFGDIPPMNSDLFHLYPTDGYVNGKRSNYPYGETDNPTWTSRNGSKLGPCSIAGYTGTVFEPIDAYKGDFARTYFYMATRYFGEDGSWPGSPMVDGAQPLAWARAMLIQWHNEDPVSQKEIDRNNAVYAIQGNRNPYIDHPEYVSQLYGGNISDEIPPVLDSISVVSEDHLKLWFNEPLDSVSASDIENYTITGNISVIASSFCDAERKCMDLQTSPFVDGGYILTVVSVSDTSGNSMQLSYFPFTVTGMGTGIRLYEKNDFLVYPNPARHSIRVASKNPVVLIQNINLFDLSGRLMSTGLQEENGKADLTLDLSPGNYILQILLENNQVLTWKVLIY